MKREPSRRKWMFFILVAAALILVGLTALRSDDPDTFNAADLRGTYAFHMASLKSFSSDQGASSGLATARGQDILRVGVFTATPDPVIPSHGSLSGRTIATTDTNSGDTRALVFSWSGEYKVNADGTGVFTINDSTSQNCYDSTAATLFTPGSVGGCGFQKFWHTSFRKFCQT